MTMRILSLLAGGLALVLVAAVPAAAMTSAAGADRDLAAETWVQDLANEATDLLAAEEITETDVAGAFQDLLVENVALRNFGRSALGPYVRTTSEEDFDRFIALLEQYGTSVVRSRFSEYSGQTVVVTGSSVDARSNFSYVNVKSDVLDQYGDVLASVSWLLIRRGEDYRVYDIMVETTDEAASFSLLQTQREEFNSVLSSNGGNIEALFNYLRRRINESGMTPAN